MVAALLLVLFKKIRGWDHKSKQLNSQQRGQHRRLGNAHGARDDLVEASCVLVPKRDACAFLAQQEKPEVLPVAGIMQKEISIFSFIPDLKFCLSAVGFCSRYISRYVNLKLGFLPFVVASIVAMVFFFAVFAARAPAMGTARTERGSSHSSWKGSRLLATPATAACLMCRPDIVCPNRLGGMMQPAKTATVHFSLAGSSLPGRRAPCTFPNLRCDSRCWLFSCLDL